MHEDIRRKQTKGMDQCDRRITRSITSRRQETVATHAFQHRRQSAVSCQAVCRRSLSPGFGFTANTSRYYNCEKQNHSNFGNGEANNRRQSEGAAQNYCCRFQRTRKDNRRAYGSSETPYHGASQSCQRERKVNRHYKKPGQKSVDEKGRKLSSYGLDFDGFTASDVSCKYLEQAPPRIDLYIHKEEADGMPSLIESLRKSLGFGNKRGKNDETPLRIKHEHEDTDQGDEFGAVLQTHENVFKGVLIRQHFLVDIEPRGPADKMRIKNNDELICVNGIFVPEKTHREVIDIFHHAKVDGKTRFHMVIRRAIPNAKERSRSNSKPQKKWQWIEMSAILAPDFREMLDKQPDVLDVESMPLSSDKYTTYVHTSYFTKNRHLFIDINERGLVADVNKSTSGDKTKILLRSGRITANVDGNLVMHAAVSDLERKRYINVVNNRVTLGSHPCWFEYWKHSSDVYFKKDDKYLACDESTGQINFISTEFEFVEVGKHHGHDFVDSGGQAATGFSTEHSLKATCESENGSLQQGSYCPLTTEDTIDGHTDRKFSIAGEYSLRSCSSNGLSAMEID
ncbi:hypothetical protein ACF0H5_020687 [Mactra antiquata]